MLGGQALACSNCHGLDGRGRREGGVVPPDLRWSTLAQEAGHRHEGGRQHGPFDPDSLARAVTTGVDPDGHALDPAMPRYAMSARDMAALGAYLRVLEEDQDPGIAADTLRIAGLLPTALPQAGFARAVREVLVGGFEEVNRRGGIHGRRLEWVELPLAPDLPSSPDAAAALERQLRAADVFAVLAPFAVGRDAELAQAADRLLLPMLGPLTLHAGLEDATSPQVFHLLSGVPDLAVALARTVRERAPRGIGRVLLWHPDDAAGQALARSVAARLQGDGWADVVLQALGPARGGGASAKPAGATVREPSGVPSGAPMPTSAAGLAERLRRDAVGTVIVLGAGADVAGLLQACSALGMPLPWVLVPGTLVTPAMVRLAAPAAQRLLLAYPQLAQRQRADARRALVGLRPDAGSVADQPMLVAAHAASLLLIEGLQRSGRALSRERLVGQLERLQGFDTGLLPPLSFAPARRVGAAGGYVVELDPQDGHLRAVGGFVPSR